jgi:hypothetical protein
MSVLPKPRPKNSMGTSYGNFTNKNTPVTIWHHEPLLSRNT